MQSTVKIQKISLPLGKVRKIKLTKKQKNTWKKEQRECWADQRA